MKYDDDYSTCESTHATLRFFHKDLIPESLDELIGIKSTYSHKSGDPISIKHPEKGSRSTGCWLLGSEGIVKSRDSRRHIDWLLDKIADKNEMIEKLQSTGYKIDIFCYWSSMGGDGGPTMSPSQSKRLGKLNIELSFDIYFLNE